MICGNFCMLSFFLEVENKIQAFFFFFLCFFQYSIKGASHKVDAAVEEAEKTIESLRSMTINVGVDQDLVRYIIGKKGATINKLRQETGTTIETDIKEGIVRIFSEDEGKREAARGEILKIIEKNQSDEIQVSREASISLKGQKGAETREKVQKLEVSMDIDGDSGLIKLRGSLGGIETAKTLLQEFSEANYGVDMDILPDEQTTITAGGDSSFRKKVQESTGANLYIIREENLLKVSFNRFTDRNCGFVLISLST